MFERFTDVPDLERYLAEFFEVHAVLGDHTVWQSSAGSLWVARSSAFAPVGASTEALGVLAMRYPPPRGDLSTPFIRKFCPGATRRVCRLEGADLDAYLRGRSIPWADEWPEGPRIVFGGGLPLGRGRVRGDVLESELSKGYRLKD